MGMDEIMEGIAKLSRGSRHKKRGKLLRPVQKEIESYITGGMTYLGLSEDIRGRGKRGKYALEVALGSYHIFHALYKLSKSRGGLTKEFDINTEAGVKASLRSINQGYEELQKEINAVIMTNFHDLEIMEGLGNTALVLAKTFPKNQEYRQLVEKCYYRLMAETWMRWHWAHNPADLGTNQDHFRKLCEFRGIDPQNPPEA